MKENKSLVRPMMESESDDPYVFDTTNQEFVSIVVTKEQFDKISEMLEDSPRASSEVLDRFKRYNNILNKGV